MSHNQTRLLLSNEDGHPEWFKFRNINKWIQKLWKPSIIGMCVGEYDGEWKDGQMHGKGTLRISRIVRRYISLGLVAFGWRLIDQGKYVGEWKNGKYFHGTCYFANGDKHFGFFKDGLAEGHGTRTYSDGRKYTGNFKWTQYHGQGTYYSSSGGKLVGRFKEGIPWFTTDFDDDQNFIGLHVRGVEREIIPLKPK